VGGYPESMDQRLSGILTILSQTTAELRTAEATAMAHRRAGALPIQQENKRLSAIAGGIDKRTLSQAHSYLGHSGWQPPQTLIPEALVTRARTYQALPR
jgi:hypothetical protein